MHEVAIQYLVDAIPGAVNNHYAKQPYRFGTQGKVPDIVVKDHEGNVIEAYEVECLGKGALPKRKGTKRILIVALKDGDWDEVKIFADRRDHAFDKMSARLGEIHQLDRKIEVQRKRLRGHLKGCNTRIGRRLAEARERKRVDEGWE